MREIIFRAKTACDPEWIYGDLLHDGLDYDVAIWEEKTKLVTAIQPQTVGQFTGLTDKNGKKVFEHDILQTFTVWADGTVEKGGIGIVQWWEHDQCYVLATKEGYHIDDFGNLGRPEYYEIIGNIHDNPELLGGEQ